jgi:cytidylate kinase
MEKYIITISRQFASLGRSIAQQLSENLQIEFYDRDIVEAAAKRIGQPLSLISDEEEHMNQGFFKRKYPLGMGIANIQDEIFSVQENIILDLAEKESCIIVGRCANSILKDKERCLHIYIYAPYESRLKNCIEVLKMEPKSAKKMIKDVDKARENYRVHYSENASSLYDGYDIMIDSSRFGVDQTAKILAQLIKDIFYN